MYRICYNFIMIKKLLRENFLLIMFLIIFVIFCLLINHTIFINTIYDIDYFFVDLFNKVINIHITKILIFITHLGDWYLPVFIIILFIIFVKNKYQSLFMILNYLCSFIFTFIIKILISRPRPLNPLIDIPDKFSFPSGHTVTSIAFYIFLYFLISKKIKNKFYKNILLIFIILLIILIAFSRLYLKVHYLTDVIGGIIIGIICVSITINIVNKNYKNKLF